MHFLAPIWLMLLVPWAALVAWMFAGRSSRSVTTALFLWPRDREAAAVQRRLRRPPAAALLVLGAILCAILGLAAPVMKGREATSLVIFVDRGPSMSALVDGAPRFLSVADEVMNELRARESAVAVEWRTADTGEIVADRRVLAPRATADLAAVSSRPSDVPSADLLLISDRAPTLSHLIAIAPKTQPANVGFEGIAWGKNQLMLRICNQSESRISRVLLRDPSGTREILFEPVSPGDTANRFIGAPGPPEWVEVDLAAGDAMPWDDVAWLTRIDGGMAVRAGQSLPPEVLRVLGAYSAAAPAARGRNALVTRDPAFTGTGVLLAETVAPTIVGELRITPHEITRGVQFPPRAAVAEAGPPGAGWTPLVQFNGRPMVAVRDAPARQAWIGFDSSEWSATVEFVLFWTQLLDWLADGPIEQAMEGGLLRATRLRGLERLASGREGAFWKAEDAPGLFHSAAGEVVALNLPHVRMQQRLDESWRGRLQKMLTRAPRPALRAPLMTAAALASACGAAILLRQRAGAQRQLGPGES